MANTILPSAKLRIIPAAPQHDEQLKILYREMHNPSPIDIQFGRGESPYTSITTEGCDSVILIGENTETGECIGMGACCIHEVVVDGKLCRVGYLNGLKLRPEYRRCTTLLPRGYSLMRDTLKDRVDFCVAFILDGAEDIRRTFETKRHRILPHYSYQCRCTSFLLRPGRRDSIGLSRGWTEELANFYQCAEKRYDLFPAAPPRPVSSGDYLVWRRNGKIVASCVLYNNQAYKNYTLNGYNGIMRFLRYFPTRWFGFPDFPEEHSLVNTASISLLVFDESLSLRDRARFIRSASSYAAEYQLCLLGMTDTDPSYRVFCRIPHVKLDCHLYTVSWDEQRDLNRSIYNDISLM